MYDDYESDFDAEAYGNKDISEDLGWVSSGEYEDEYDRYEDYVTETGNDPYRLFEDDTRQLPLLRLKNRLRALWWHLRHIWNMCTSAKYRANQNEIPF